MQRRSCTWLSALLLSVALGGCDSSSSPTAPRPAPMPVSGMGSFTITGSGGSEMFGYSEGMNTMFCTRNAGWASLFIRIAEQSTNNGTDGPHLDIDLCNHQEGGTFTAKSPNDASCGEAKTWDVFWHAADGSVFANQAPAMGCTLEMDQTGNQLSGSFSCPQLVEIGGGGRRVDVVGGSFSCTEI